MDLGNKHQENIQKIILMYIHIHGEVTPRVTMRFSEAWARSLTISYQGSLNHMVHTIQCESDHEMHTERYGGVWRKAVRRKEKFKV